MTSRGRTERNQDDLVRALLSDLGIERDYNNCYPGWVLEMAERLIEAGWSKPEAEAK